MSVIVNKIEMVKMFKRMNVIKMINKSVHVIVILVFVVIIIFLYYN